MGGRAGAYEVLREGLADIGAEMIQCSIDHDGGLQLMGLGGAMAMLRYTMEG